MGIIRRILLKGLSLSCLLVTDNLKHGMKFGKLIVGMNGVPCLDCASERIIPLFD